MKIAIDLGFGFTKVAYSKDGEIKTFKFPSWVAYFDATPLTQIKPVEVENVFYVVGEYAKYERQKLEMSSIEEFIKLSPVFVQYVFDKVGKPDSVVVGIAPKFKNYIKEITERIKSALGNYNLKILPQGYGAYTDIYDLIPDVKDSDTLVVDIGFNTVDYVLVSATGEKLKGDTIEKLGITEAVSLFRSLIPDRYMKLKDYSPSRLIPAFESGTIRFEGSDLNLMPFREKAVQQYSEILLSRLKEEIGPLVTEIPVVALVGGGAYYVTLPLRGLYVPPEPEFSNVRGFLKYLLSTSE